MSDRRIFSISLKNDAPNNYMHREVFLGRHLDSENQRVSDTSRYIVVDGRHVETGSFNFTTAAARRNSENVAMLWNNQDAARQYIAHWQSRWEQGQQYQSSY